MTDNDQSHRSFSHRDAQDFFRQIDIQLLVHELKGPLSVIENNNRMLLEWQHRYGRLNERQENALKRCLRCADKLNNIIQNILAVGRIEAGCIHLHRFDLVHSIMEILAALIETEFCEAADKAHNDGGDDADWRCAYLLANGLSLDISQEVQGLVLHQDEAMFSHILTNLVRNALQHKKSCVIVHVALKKPNIEISVNDDGHGIPPEDQPALFQRYIQTKTCYSKRRTKGHGLGLASSRILARRLGGDITIDTQCRSGSRFVLTLPLDMDAFNKKEPL